MLINKDLCIYMAKRKKIIDTEHLYVEKIPSDIRGAYKVLSEFSASKNTLPYLETRRILDQGVVGRYYPEPVYKDFEYDTLYSGGARSIYPKPPVIDRHSNIVIDESKKAGHYPPAYPGQPYSDNALFHELSHDLTFLQDKDIQNEADTLATLIRKLAGKDFKPKGRSENETDILGWTQQYVSNLTSGQRDSVLHNKYLPKGQSLLLSKEGTRKDLADEVKLRALKMLLKYYEKPHLSKRIYREPRILDNLISGNDSLWNE